MSLQFSITKTPVLFLSHGGGPCWFLESKNENDFLNEIDRNSKCADFMRNLSKNLSNNDDKPLKPNSIIIISAHWETAGSIHITSNENHNELLYDYYGFPKEAYELKYSTSGNPQLSQRIGKLLNENGVKAEIDSKRKLDHGVFIPLKLIYPNADIPIVQISIHESLDPALHFKIGKILSIFRNENILIVGSGSTTHSFNGLSQSDAKQFVNSLNDILTNKTSQEREEALLNWKKLPKSKECHPREEHLIPLHVIVGAALNDKGIRLFSQITKFGSFALDSWKFG